MLLSVSIYSYFGQAFVACVPTVPTAQILAAVFIGLNNFFSGLIVRPQYLSSFFEIPYWITPGKFATLIASASSCHRASVKDISQSFYLSSPRPLRLWGACHCRISRRPKRSSSRSWQWLLCVFNVRRSKRTMRWHDRRFYQRFLRWKVLKVSSLVRLLTETRSTSIFWRLTFHVPLVLGMILLLLLFSLLLQEFWRSLLWGTSITPVSKKRSKRVLVCVLPELVFRGRLRISSRLLHILCDAI
jgi:hypothetical protein